MEVTTKTATTHHHSPLRKVEPMLRTFINRAFAVVYSCAILALLYHHTLTILQSTTLLSFNISLLLLISDIILVFMWATSQCFRMRPVLRHLLVETPNSNTDFLRMDVFVCTADPYKEPPLSVVNTVLSVMGYDYPMKKVSVYVSDDGGSKLTLFALMEGAKFARHWLPFCKKNNVEHRCPQAYFENNPTESLEIMEIKVMYEDMKMRIERVMEQNKVLDKYINGDEQRLAFNKFTDNFTRQDHPTVIQVLLENGSDRDITGHSMRNLIYVSREKCRTLPHNFKAGALNTLLRVSATMTNAPVILTLDCDMYSNDPQTLQQVFCYFLDSTPGSNLGYVQFPQRFHGINKDDIYACHYKRMFQIFPLGLDGLQGPDYEGTGCFFSRRALFGSPSSIVSPDIIELNPNYIVNKPIKAQEILSLAHHVASCHYEHKTNWGSKIGFRYGSLVEDTNTGYRLQCEGWRSIFCHPKRAAFLGQVPTNLEDVLIQTKRWAVGLLQLGFSTYSPLTFGTRSMGLLMGLCYSHYVFWAFWAIPITVYAFLPQIALLNGLSIFPKADDPWFLLYALLFIGSYTQDYLEFKSTRDTTTTSTTTMTKQWYNDQRMWMIRGLTSFLFGSLHYFFNSNLDFTITQKSSLNDDESESIKRYHQCIFDFDTKSITMYVPITAAAIVNLVSFIDLVMEFVVGGRSVLRDLFVQAFLVCFVVVNCLPVYEAMFCRDDRGKIPWKVSVISTGLGLVLYVSFSLVLSI